MIKSLRAGVIYPFLFAAFPVFSLYYHNVSEVLPWVFVTPLLASLLLVGLILGISRLLMGDWNKSGLLTTFTLFVIFSHGHLHNLIGARFPDIFGNGAHDFGIISLGIDDILFIFWGSLSILVFYLLLKTKRNLNRLTKALTFAAVLLAAVPTMLAAFYKLSNALPRVLQEREDNFGEEVSLEIRDDSPDIYYIILDRYASNETLKDFYGYDNSIFLNYLEEKGFYVADQSTANYPRTLFSMASSLNMEYINYLTDLAGEETDDQTFAYPLVGSHKVGETLRANGYRYLHLGAWFEPTKANIIADQNFVMGDLYLGRLDGFSTELLNTTVFAPLIRKFFPETSAGDFNTQHANRILYQFDQLEKIPALPGPKFVLAHILIPHPPFIFDSECNSYPGRGRIAPDSSIEGYINQMICGNSKVTEMVENILADSPNPPVIVIQADEGPYARKYPMPPGRFNFKDASDNTLKERFWILNALYLPGADASDLYPSITPVNTFRFIFKQYFGADLDLIPDINYIYEDEDHLYKFIDVTDRLK